MDLEDLKRLWEDHDRKLDAGLRLNRRLLEQTVLGKAETRIRRLSRYLVLELALDVALAFWVGSFAAEHVGEARFLVPAVALHLCVLALAVASIRQLVAIGALDYGAPIVSIQRRLESLRVERLRATKLTLLFAPLVWTPLLIVIVKSLVGLDAYAAFGVPWLAANLLFGLLAIPLGIALSRRYADRMASVPFVQRLMRDLAGRSLSDAADFLGSISRFEEEERDA
ncbi:MAG TPA: hypothetical protein VKF32_00420 [Thermoanaerobaculia bacterium]|nr:hypothetical protein [Thermoanaerobaculia bacterium]